MAKYTVTFSCGHTQTVELFGTSAERERKIAYYEKSGICSDCYKSELEAQKAAIAEQNATMAALIGSPKQIEWAEKIRVEKITPIEEIPANKPSDVEIKNQIISILKNQTSASWWIDRRNQSHMQILREIQASVLNK